MAKLKKGTSQAFLSTQTEKYHIETWNGNSWSMMVVPSFDTKKEADEYGFANKPLHRK